MQSAILQRAEQLLREKNYNINIEKFIHFLEISKHNYIYTDALERYTQDNIVEIYKALEFLCVEKILKRYCQAFCPDCSRYIGKGYEKIQDLPKEIFCPHCGEMITDIRSNLFLIYRVVE